MTREGVVSNTAPKTKSAKAKPAARPLGQQDSFVEPFVRRLSELESLIRSDKIAVDLDKHLIWVDATINDAHTLKMLFDARVEQTRVPASTAAGAGLRVSDIEPAVEVTSLDGRKYQARRARLSSIKVGTSVLHDLDCLVMPPEFGEAPALLGRDFLNRFTPTVNHEAGTVTLTQLQVKPVFRSGRPAH